mmetsp:Transcript_21002/g.21791  ORF Transcript_21002/g.21791 Transcript_21002/m.21791 type:complete len:117 (-) Transcript_21002:364-714(-)
MNFIRRAFRVKKKIKSDTQTSMNMNIKGQQVKDSQPKYSEESIFKEANIQSAYPTMYSTSTRIRIWSYLAIFCVYIYLLSKLMLHRLKADDLDLMEREVNRDWEIRRKVKELETDK